MIPAYVLDTSVVVKWFVERGEADVARARGLQSASLEGRCRLIAPDLLFVEAANALVAGRRYTPEQVRLALRSIQVLGVDVLPVRLDNLDRAVETAVALGMPVYDSYFLAVAVNSGSILVTADDKFLRRLGPHPSAIALRDLRLPD